MPAPFYTDEIAKLEAGLGSGEAKIESEGEAVTYRGVRDIMVALEYFRTKAAAASVPAIPQRPASTLAVFYPD